MEEKSGAIRMVAFGVLELPKQSLGQNITIKEIAAVEDKRTEIINLVSAEVRSMGWLLKGIARRLGHGFILLGPKRGTPALVVRPKIGEGTLQEVCLAAVKYLDGTHILDCEVLSGTTKD